MIQLFGTLSLSFSEEEKRILLKKDSKRFSKIRKGDFNKIYNVFERYFEEKNMRA